MIACLRLLHWAAAVTRQQNPALAGVPLVIGGRAWESAPVTAVSAEAQEAGVRVGMLLKQAWALCPGAHFLPLNEAICQQAHDALLDLLWDFSDRRPYFELPDTASIINTVSGDGNFPVYRTGDTIVINNAPRQLNPSKRQDFQSLKTRIPVDTGFIGFCDADDVALPAIVRLLLFFFPQRRPALTAMVS